MKFSRAIVFALLLTAIVATAIGSVSASGIPPDNPAMDPPADQDLPEVTELAPAAALPGLQQAKSRSPRNVPPN